METLVLDGKKYVKASKAAKAAGYTSDYVGQLCRGGKVDAHLVGRSWYVNQDELGTHRTEKKRMSRAKAREQVKKAVAEKQEISSKTVTKNYESRIQYENDESDLMPEVRKVTVQTEAEKPSRSKKKKTKKPSSEQEKYTVENEGDKVLMSGSIDVVDATDEQFMDEDTVFLQAHITEHKKKMSEKTKERATKSIVATVEEEAENVITPHTEETVPEKTDFLDKLALLEEDPETAIDETEVSEVSVAEGGAQAPQQDGVFKYVLVLVVFTLLSVSTVVLESTWSYQSDRDTKSGVHSKSGFRANINTVLDKINQKI